MSEQSIVASSPPSSPASRASSRTRTAGMRAAVLAGVILLAELVKFAFIVWHQPYEKGSSMPYADFVAIRDSWWAVHVMGAAALATAAIAVTAACCVLARTRGAGFATAGAALTAVGAPLLAIGIGGDGIAARLAATPDLVPPETGAKLLNYVLVDAGEVLLPLLVGLALYVVGTILAGVGLLRARVVPRWIPIALIIGTPLLAASPHAIEWLGTLPEMTAAIAVAYYACRVRRA